MRERTRGQVTSENFHHEPSAGGIVTKRRHLEIVRAALGKPLKFELLFDGSLTTTITREDISYFNGGPTYGLSIFWDSFGRVRRVDFFGEDGGICFQKLYKFDKVGRLVAFIRMQRNNQGLMSLHDAEEYKYLDNSPESKFETHPITPDSKRKKKKA